MIRLGLAATAALAAMVAATNLSAKESAALPPIEPKGPWTVHEEQTFCALSRTYPTPDGDAMLALQPTLGADGSMTMSWISPSKGGAQRSGDARITRQPGNITWTGQYYSTHIPKRDQRVTQIWLPGEAFAGIAATTSLNVRAAPVDVAVTLTVSSKVLGLHRNCEDGLLQSWGIQPAAFRGGLGPKPTRPPHTYFGSDSYPKEALSGRFIGTIRAILIVGANGAVEDCKIVTRIGTLFDKATCDNGSRMRFEPAIDNTGAPTRGFYALNITWKLG